MYKTITPLQARRMVRASDQNTQGMDTDRQSSIQRPRLYKAQRRCLPHERHTREGCKLEAVHERLTAVPCSAAYSRVSSIGNPQVTRSWDAAAPLTDAVALPLRAL